MPPHGAIPANRSPKDGKGGREDAPASASRSKRAKAHAPLLVEARQIGQPRVIREAADHLMRAKSELAGAYGVIIAPYISPQSAAICLKEGLGFADLAGNCILNFDQVFISQEGKENPFSRKRDLRSLYSPKAERVLRPLFAAPRRWWKVQSLAKEAGVSLGQSFNVKKLLLDREWMEIGDEGFRLTAPADSLPNGRTTTILDAAPFMNTTRAGPSLI